jgi:hypothetical protein
MVIFFMTACNPNATKKLLGVWERIEKFTNENGLVCILQLEVGH